MVRRKRSMLAYFMEVRGRKYYTHELIGDMIKCNEQHEDQNCWQLQSTTPTLISLHYLPVDLCVQLLKDLELLLNAGILIGDTLVNNLSSLRAYA